MEPLPLASEIEKLTSPVGLIVTRPEPGEVELKLIPAPPEAIGEESLLIAAVRSMFVPPSGGVTPPEASRPTPSLKLLS